MIAALGYIYSLFALSAIMIIGNLAIRIAGGKRLQFAFNLILPVLLLVNMGIIYAFGISGLFFGAFTINPFSLLFSGLFTLGLLTVTLIAFGYSDEYQDFAVIIAFALIGMYAVSMSSSLITIFLGLELSSIPMVFAVLLSRRGIEAAAKLFIMSSIAISVLSFAIVLLYGSSNSLALTSYPHSAVVAFAALLFIAALGFEASIFPFNVLIPDVYTGSSAYITGMLGGINKKVGFVALMQVLILVFITDSKLFLIVAALSVLTMFYGNIVALMQRNTKRMLAYSSISQAGYILIGIATATAAGIAASIFQIFSHMFIFIGMLGVVALLESRNRNGIDELIGLNGENRFAAFAMALFMLSLIGLPLTTGFVGKFLIFLSAVNSGLLWLAIIGILNSIISVLYYARAIMAMYTGKAGGNPIIMGKPLLAALILCVAVTIVFGIYPQPIIGLANSAAGYLISV
ncbi:MAG: NADH-quinone oxidoreductase subunit N [Candidatus Marsarchaeota archaeon]|nr:NADH-quinone oxidoreductase subunit N [Candidatus Marsarchaeota archaeon]MCL5412848.1 NADH-quinone oxidoreductase subunit N [Candidatus Marsarchaeota archaeon]